MPYQVGQRVGDYEIVQILGAGGMGEVYKVRNLISDRMDAMKVLLPDLEDNPELADRFLREIKVQARLSHPNIAALYTAIRHEGKLLMVMEYIDGYSLEQRLGHGPLPPAEAIGYVRQVIAALAFAHSKGVVHRDIKPANMMLSRDGAVKLMDFGIARMKEDRKLTQTGQTVGSLYYMSPEQIRGEDLDGRSDLYSLGIALYELVTGKRPYESGSDFSIMAAHLKENPVPPIQIDPSLPPRLNEIILMAIAKDAAQRFQTAAAFDNALANAVGTAPAPAAGQVATEIKPAPVAGPPASHRGLYMAIGSLATVAAPVVLITQGPKWFSAGAAPKPAQAVEEPVAVQQSPATASAPVTAQPVQEAAAPAAAPAAPPAAPPAPASVPPMIRRNLPERLDEPAAVKPNPPPQEKPASPVVASPPPAAPAPAPAPAPATAPAADGQVLEALEDRLMKLGIRVAAIQEKVRSIAQQQAAQGVGMRADVKSAQTLTNYLMDQAEKRLRAQDAAGTRSQLDKAERQVETLERILGL